jgi:lipopolysaccharide transport system ATP-binding protein
VVLRKKMTDISIRVDKLSKLYHLGSKKGDSIKDTFKNFFSGKNEKDNDENSFWALKDVSFEVKQGEVLGVVGRNGAGKSTLLKLLSRITEPTSGIIEINGRVSSLLEVGTGFHPELSGRENIFLNGTILGMKRAEIRQKFDEIIDFSGVEKFIDTPVKHYSSGMYVRLAFAVAAHLEPEILIIDEVLAVGDAAFQNKCLGKMQDVAGSGRTVLFVSHNMQAVRALCNMGVFFQNGELVGGGMINSVLDLYEKSIKGIKIDEKTSINDEKGRRGLGYARYSDIHIQDKESIEKNIFNIGQQIEFVLTFKVYQDLSEVFIVLALRSGMSRELVTSFRHRYPEVNLKKGGTYRFKIIINNPSIRPGEYPLYFWLGDKDNRALDVVDDLILPLKVTAEGTIDSLGFDPTVHTGYFSTSSLISIYN